MFSTINLAISTPTLTDRILENAAGCALGSAAAIIISIWIYKGSNRAALQAAERQRLDNEALQTADELNQMRAFKVLLQRSIRTSEIWSDGIKQFIVDLKNHSVVFPLPVLTSIANLKRITDTITIEKTGRTYMKHFPSENSAGEFISILEVVDYLSAEFNALQETIKTASVNHQNRLREVSDKLDEADKLILDNLEHLEQIGLNQEIQAIKKNFTKNRGEGSDIHAVNKLYFIPMDNLMRRILGGEYMDEFIKYFAYAISKGIEFYSYIGNGYDRFHSEMVEIEGKIIANTEKLKVTATKILQSDLS